jgi:NAD(P)-dependent dehydrogenase (short-subunit alcohol dehydrogenase family)
MADENDIGADPLGSGPDGPRVAVVTGGSSGIGLAAAEQLARLGWVVALVGRNPDRLISATDRVRAAAPDPARVHTYRADFTVLAQVRALAKDLRADHPHVDMLANNAGGAFRRRTITVDGFELTMQVNHLAPFLLSNLLRETLAGGRIINTSSGAHASGQLDPADLNSSGPQFRTLGYYGSSKQANILFAVEATRRWPEITSVAYHPGVVRTNFGNDRPAVGFFIRWAFFMPSPAKGADTLVWLAEQPLTDLVPGGYYQRRRLRTPAPRATDPDLAAELWEVSAAAVGL